MTCCACERPGGLELTGRMLAAAGLPAGAAVLDVGCGAGASVAHLADEHGLRATGLDASSERVRRARGARPDLEFVTGRAEALPFEDAVFDAVLCECVLSTVDDAGVVVAEMARLLRPGGKLLLSDLYLLDGSTAPPGAVYPDLGRREAVEALLGGAGLAVVLWEDRTGALGRYLWDTAGSGAPPPRHRPAGAGSGRRLGYFTCVARTSGPADKEAPRSTQAWA